MRKLEQSVRQLSVICIWWGLFLPSYSLVLNIIIELALRLVLNIIIELALIFGVRSLCRSGCSDFFFSLNSCYCFCLAAWYYHTWKRSWFLSLYLSVLDFIFLSVYLSIDRSVGRSIWLVWLWVYSAVYYMRFLCIPCVGSFRLFFFLFFFFFFSSFFLSSSSVASVLTFSQGSPLPCRHAGLWDSKGPGEWVQFRLYCVRFRTTVLRSGLMDIKGLGTESGKTAQTTLFIHGVPALSRCELHAPCGKIGSITAVW